jgi:xylulokinase
LTYTELYQMPDITVIGGSTRNELLLEIKASVLKTPHQILDREEATCLGASILGGIAAGIYRDANDAFAHLDSQPRTIEPDHEAAAFYEEWYSAVYERLFRALQPIHQTIHDLVVDASSEWRQNDSTTSHAER